MLCSPFQSLVFWYIFICFALLWLFPQFFLLCHWKFILIDNQLGAGRKQIKRQCLMKAIAQSGGLKRAVVSLPILLIRPFVQFKHTIRSFNCWEYKHIYIYVFMHHEIYILIALICGNCIWFLFNNRRIKIGALWPWLWIGCSSGYSWLPRWWAHSSYWARHLRCTTTRRPSMCSSRMLLSKSTI